MLAVQITPRRKKYVSFTPDTHPNKGGFFCEVYEDEMGEFATGDSFVVHNYEIRSGKTDDEKRSLAYKVAINKVKSLYK